MNTASKAQLVVAVSLLLVALASPLFAQGGSLTPPGPPGVTMKTLDEVEPRIPLDPANAPFTINAPGSYYLTGNITNLPATTGAIAIHSSDVTLDLNGFSIISTGGLASGADSESAIWVSSGSLRGVVIRNGHISGGWSAGVYANGQDHVIEHLTMRDLAYWGILASSRCHIRDCVIRNVSAASFSLGITAFSSLIERCLVTECSAEGFQTSGCVIRDCIAQMNGTNGIFDAGDGAQISRCAAFFNGQAGISAAGAGAIISHCTAAYNAANGIENSGTGLITQSAAFDNDGAGIRSSGSCTILDSSAYRNDGAGIDAGSRSLVSRCHAGFNLGNGISVTTESRIIDCIAERSGQGTNASAVGILGTDSCQVESCTATASGAAGIQLGANAAAKNCDASGNGGGGIVLGIASRANDCTAYNNGGDGLAASTSSTVAGITAYNNGGDGMDVGNGSTILTCTVQENTGNGIDASSNCTISNCTAYRNGLDGIKGSTACLIRHCTTNLNGKKTGAPTDPAGAGIEVLQRCLVVGCVTYDNAGAGVDCTGANNRNFIESCQIYANDSGGIDLQGNGNNVIRNYVSANTGFDINQSGGDIGPFQNASTATSPTANYQ